MQITPLLSKSYLCIVDSSLRTIQENKYLPPNTVNHLIPQSQPNAPSALSPANHNPPPPGW
jgi:hypothetical protein